MVQAIFFVNTYSKSIEPVVKPSINLNHANVNSDTPFTNSMCNPQLDSSAPITII